MGNSIQSSILAAQEKEMKRYLMSRVSQKNRVADNKMIGVDEREMCLVNYSKNIREDRTKQNNYTQTETIQFSANGQNEQLANAVFAEIYGSTPFLEPSVPPPPPKSKLRTQGEIRDQMKPVVNLTCCCSQCKIGFSNYSKLRVHVQANHYCFVCLRYFFNVADLLNHNEKVHNKPFFPCARCGDEIEPFTSPDSLLVHSSLKHSRDFQSNCLICNFKDDGNPAGMWKHLDGHLIEDGRKFQEKHYLPLDHTINVYVLYGTKDSENMRGSDTVLPVHYYIMPLEEPELRQARRQNRTQIARSKFVRSAGPHPVELVLRQLSNTPQARRKHGDRDPDDVSPPTTRKKPKSSKEDRIMMPIRRIFSDKENIIEISQTIEIDVEFEEIYVKPDNAKINYQANHSQSFRIKGATRPNARHKQTNSGRF